MSRSFLEAFGSGLNAIRAAFAYNVLPALAEQRYSAKGLFLGSPQSTKNLASGPSPAKPSPLRDAMVMPIDVPNARELDGPARSTMIEFSLVADKEHPYAESLRI